MSKEKILITGSNGFVGKHLIAQLKKQQYSTIEFDVDVGQIESFDFKNHYTDVKHVFHLAAKTFVPHSWEYPQKYYSTNTLGTANILDFCKFTGASLTYLNTYVYGKPQYLPIDEKHPLNPNTPYNHSKMLGEDICHFYSEHMQVSVTSFRIFNIYGRNQNPNFLIPHIINQVLDPHSNTVNVQNLQPKRDYIYIDDLICALLKTINPSYAWNVFNLGTGESHSVLDIINKAQEIAGTNKKIVSSDTVRRNEVFDIVADISFVKNTLDFNIKTSLEQGLDKIINGGF